MQKSKNRKALDIRYKKNKDKIRKLQPNLELKGFDLFSYSKNNKFRTIEVKGTANTDDKGKPKGIPDPSHNEFVGSKNNLKLKADFIYLVHFKTNGKEDLYIIPRKDIKSRHVKQVPHFKISPKFITDKLAGHKVT